MGFRASKAFSSVQGLAFGGAGGTAGGKPGAGGLPLEEETPTDLPGLKMQNERLTNALIVLNQKLKVHEDNEDLNEKWKAQIASKDSQLSLANEQITTQEDEIEKQRRKIKELSS